MVRRRFWWAPPAGCRWGFWGGCGVPHRGSGMACILCVVGLGVSEGGAGGAQGSGWRRGRALPSAGWRRLLSSAFIGPGCWSAVFVVRVFLGGGRRRMVMGRRGSELRFFCGVRSPPVRMPSFSHPRGVRVTRHRPRWGTLAALFTERGKSGSSRRGAVWWVWGACFVGFSGGRGNGCSRRRLVRSKRPDPVCGGGPLADAHGRAWDGPLPVRGLGAGGAGPSVFQERTPVSVRCSLGADQSGRGRYERGSFRA